MAPRLRERRGGNGPVNQLENKSSHHECLLSLTRTAGNAANWPVASRRSFWSRDPQAPHPPPWPVLECLISAHAEVQTGLISNSLLLLRRPFQFSTLCTLLKMMKQTHAYIVAQRRKLSLIFRAASGRSDRYLLRFRERGWDESIPLGPCSFLINNGRCSTPRLLCIRCIPGSPYEVHLPHTRTHPAPMRKVRLSLVPRGHGRRLDTPPRALGVDNSLSLFTQANI